MLTVALVPARCGSKSVPDKNIFPLGGHPLVAYSIAAGMLAGDVSEVVVSTDSEKYADICRRYGANVPFLRPEAISRDSSLDIEFVRHYLDFLAERGLPEPDLIVHLRPTTPLRETAQIDAAVAYMQANPEATALRSAHRTSMTPYKMFVQSGEYMEACMKLKDEAESYNLPRQRFPRCYVPNGHVDILRPSVLHETGTLHGPRIKLWETRPVADIDEMCDCEFAERLLHDPAFRALRQYLEEAL
ncbi:acylneuraminate cytidylyltransferase family protein [uncultured Pseudodesulfovibrio sp.]|uniref:acylneuraminate cytidylyltransferase family protein n=1 Tax=uncultured Pseudodesulfovibrio sp. TaxID=2035858 RepID=UPI0029C6CA61|nr:acylneuraminate cytidylyltransferase family protein [uncultured Pseudodesulfovibrio sp.]